MRARAGDHQRKTLLSKFTESQKEADVKSSVLTENATLVCFAGNEECSGETVRESSLFQKV